jgi:hypothetical protein
VVFGSLPWSWGGFVTYFSAFMQVGYVGAILPCCLCGPFMLSFMLCLTVSSYLLLLMYDGMAIL